MNLYELEKKLKISIDGLRQSKAGLKAICGCHSSFFLSYKKVIQKFESKDTVFSVFKNHALFMRDVCKQNRIIKEKLSGLYDETKRFTGIAKSVYASLKIIMKKEKQSKSINNGDIKTLERDIEEIEKKTLFLVEKALCTHRECIFRSIEDMSSTDTTSRETSEKNRDHRRHQEESAEKQQIDEAKRRSLADMRRRERRESHLDEDFRPNFSFLDHPGFEDSLVSSIHNQLSRHFY